MFWRHLFLCAGGVSHSPAFSGTNMAAGGRDHGKFFFSHGSLRKNTLNICTWDDTRQVNWNIQKFSFPFLPFLRRRRLIMERLHNNCLDAASNSFWSPKFCSEHKKLPSIAAVRPDWHESRPLNGGITADHFPVCRLIAGPHGTWGVTWGVSSNVGTVLFEG